MANVTGGRLLAIDPGTRESAFCVIDVDTRTPLRFGKQENTTLIWSMYTAPNPDTAVIEMVASYGMAVGAEVFETVRWIGRFEQQLEDAGISVQLVTRRLVKLHHCGSAKANDSSIRQALVDRFASGQPNHGKGTKAAPGFFHGFHSDIWQAAALAVYAADIVETGQ